MMFGDFSGSGALSGSPEVSRDLPGRKLVVSALPGGPGEPLGTEMFDTSQTFVKHFRDSQGRF